ncbi:MAG TPA: hypothetical protein VJ866_21465 [Pyrinomonadaceae bacterium]|nr:hypothetical protein [Pyrinomonadaceae bacterium]
MKRASMFLLTFFLALAAVHEPRAARVVVAYAVSNVQTGQTDDTNFLTGTYRELESQDDEIGRKVLAETSHLERDEREKYAKEFYKVLAADPLFAIEQYDTTVTINYPAGRRVPFEADGKVRRFRVRGAGLLELRASLEGRRLVVDFAWPEGDRLRLVYEKSADGRRLTFTRSAASRAVPLPITVSSEYEVVSPRATRTFAGLLPR